MNDTETIRWTQDAEGIVTLTMDDPSQRANTVNDAYVASMGRAIERLTAERDTVTGVILTSAKPTFFAGGDLNDLFAAGPEDGPALAAKVRTVKVQLRKLETLGVPVVAAINGAALGGGLEIAFGTHHRVAIDAPKVQVGFPEVTLGLLPGGGGIVRAVRMLGVERALDELLLKGRRLRPAAALDLGIVDELVPDEEELIVAAKRWIATGPEASQPWDRRGYRIPGGDPSDPSQAAGFAALSSRLRKQLKGANYPAPRAILAAAVEGAQVDFDGASEIEGRYFVNLATGPVAKNMIQANFFDLQRVRGDRGRSQDAEPAKVGKVAVLGAGMMGAGIGYVCAKAGIEVVLRDVDLKSAERGKAYSEKLVARGRVGEAEGRELLARIKATADVADAAGADLLIEAVFEDPEVKARVLREAEPHLAADALLGSNTSTLPITDLAADVTRPESFIGLHFFSPVDRMPLLEIIKGEATSEESLHRALDFAAQIGKTPIVVNDSRGFFTSRVIRTFIGEGIAMLAEGIPAPSIEQASLQAGYPTAVLALADEVNIKLIQAIREAAKKAAVAEGKEWVEEVSAPVIDRMVDGVERPGRAGGAGFYEYEEGKRGRLWSGLAAEFDAETDSIPPLRDLIDRMLFIESLEALRCLEEGVIESVADANVGSILGIGFPGWTGGVLQFVNGHEGGAAGYLARARELRDTYGERFEPPQILVSTAESGGSFTDDQLLAPA